MLNQILQVADPLLAAARSPPTFEVVQCLSSIFFNVLIVFHVKYAGVAEWVCWKEDDKAKVQSGQAVCIFCQDILHWSRKTFIAYKSKSDLSH